MTVDNGRDEMSGMIRFEEAPFGPESSDAVQQIMFVAYNRARASFEDLVRRGRPVTTDAISPDVLLEPLTLDHRACEWSISGVPETLDHVRIECAAEFAGSAILLSLLPGDRDDQLAVEIAGRRIFVRTQGRCHDYQAMVDAIDFKIYRIRKEMDRQSLDVRAVNRLITAPSTSIFSTIMITQRRKIAAK